MQGLCATQGSRQRFNGSPSHIVEGVLLGEAPARGLAVRAQRHRLGIFGAKLLDNF